MTLFPYTTLFRSPKYFGNTALKAEDMPQFVKSSLKDLQKEVGQRQFLQLVHALAAEGGRGDGSTSTDKVSEDVKLLFEDFTCTDCHRFHDKGKLGIGPDLTGYGSREWITGVISDPAQKRFYGKHNDRMPAYAKTPERPQDNILTARQVEMLADWLRGRWYELPAQ